MNGEMSDNWVKKSQRDQKGKRDEIWERGR